MQVTTAVFDNIRDWAKNAQSDVVPDEKLIAPRETSAGACANLGEQRNSSVPTFLLTDSEGEGGTSSLRHLRKGRRASKMLSAVLGARLRTHIAEFGFLVLLGGICFLFSLSVLPPGPISPKLCMKFAHAQVEHGREKEKGQLQLTKASKEEKGIKDGLGGRGREREGFQDI